MGGRKLPDRRPAEIQHYVPRFLLRGFSTSGRRPHVFVYDKHEGRLFRTSVANLAAERRFYDFNADAVDVSLEPYLSNLESEASRLVGEIRSNRSIGLLSGDGRSLLSEFVAVQMLRTRHQKRMISDVDASFFRQMEERGIDPTDAWGIRQLSDDDVQALFLKALLNPQPYAAILDSKTWTLMSTPASQPFFCSDHPVALQNNSPTDGLTGNLGLAVEGIEIYVPISSTLTLAMLCPSHEEKLREVSVMQEEMAKVVDAAHSLPGRDFVNSWLSSIDSGGALEIPEESLVNLNSLQVVFSTRFVFSADSNFSLVERMLGDRPELRDGIGLGD